MAQNPPSLLYWEALFYIWPHTCFQICNDKKKIKLVAFFHIQAGNGGMKQTLSTCTYTDPMVTNASELGNTDQEMLYLRQMLFLFKGKTWSATVLFAYSWKTVKIPWKLTLVIKQINRISKLIMRIILWLHSYCGLLKSMRRKFIVLERQRKQLKFYCQFSIPQDFK